VAVAAISVRCCRLDAVLAIWESSAASCWLMAVTPALMPLSSARRMPMT
jgi:hypothetical protein